MNALVELAYLLAAVFFIFGLKWLSSPATARKGNALASLGMLIAILVTLLEQREAAASKHALEFVKTMLQWKDEE